MINWSMKTGPSTATQLKSHLSPSPFPPIFEYLFFLACFNSHITPKPLLWVAVLMTLPSWLTIKTINNTYTEEDGCFKKQMSKARKSHQCQCQQNNLFFLSSKWKTLWTCHFGEGCLRLEAEITKGWSLPRSKQLRDAGFFGDMFKQTGGND